MSIIEDARIRLSGGLKDRAARVATLTCSRKVWEVGSVDTGHTTQMTAETLRHRLELLLAEHDRPGAVAAVLHAVERGDIDVPSAYHDVLVPAIKQIGQAWQYGRLRVWEEHFASATIRTIVEALYPHVRRLKEAGIPTGKKVLLACIVDERHDLGLRMLSDVFEVNGWTTYYLGADTPTIQIEDAALMLKVDLIVLASVTLVDRLQARHVLDELHLRLPETRVVVACSDEVCADTALSPSEKFRAEEFFGPQHPAPSPTAGDEGSS